ncbi:OmpL47-type beta-barrel domain-containing protein [Halorussus lipolyticus]|uniref:OmpL47-type beta-barrel domain-containing protein n=1 Tax=Halorussus lipolyticus TaxID=3034024 RepID=UPI0023E8A3FD|nr:S8 family serine peptidase [Halorussus sp. DT80]
MTRQRLSAVFFSILLVVSAATAAVPASALAPNGGLGVAGNEAGNTGGNDATTTLTTTTTVANDETTTITETTTTVAETTTVNETTTTEDETENRSGPSARTADPKVSSALLDRVDLAATGPTADSTGGTEFVQVVVRSSSGQSEKVAGLVGNYDGEVQARHGNLVQARIPAAAVTSLAESPAVEFARRPRTPETDEIRSEGLSNMDVGNVHDAGVTGENVTVAVIDMGFDVTNPEISDQLTDWRNFSSPGSPNTMQNESGLHGTGTAELVADTAPNASIVAVKVGTEVELYEAIDWIEANTSADVVTMSLGWYNVGPLDGTAQMNREIDTSVQNGTTWLTSAGNEADQSHWNGTWESSEDRWLNFTATDDAMNVTPAGGAGAVSIAISWNDWGGSNENYDAYLYNASGDIVAGSATYQNGTQNPTEYIYEYVNEPVYLRIYNRSANGTSSFDVFFRGNSDPEYWTKARSLTVPATGPEVITVGATHYEDNRLESFSSRGPTIDGRVKPDVVAPDGMPTSAYPDGFYGTSAAAPHTAGVAALMLDANESLTPAEVEERLESSAVPLRGTEPNSQTGYGLVDADGAIASVEEPFPDRVTYSADLTEADGDAAVDDDVVAYALDSSRSAETTTDATGNFSMMAEGANDSYLLGYYQGDFDQPSAEFMARDGSPDLQALGIVNATNSSDLGDVTLPEAHVLNVTVVDESGAPVSNAEVDVMDFQIRNGEGGYVPFTAETDADGRLVVAGRPGIEVVGDVRVRAAPPDGTTRFAGSNYTEVIDVQSDTNLTLTLDSAGASVSGLVTDAAGNASSDDLVSLSSDVTGDFETAYTNATGDFTVTGVETGAPYTVGYYQDWNAMTVFPRDGVADLYALDRVNVTGDTDLGRFEVPNASVMNVRVVDESGEAVPGANVSVAHHGQNATTVLSRVSMDSQGWITPGEGRGIEVTGEVTVEVTPPESDLFVGKNYTRNLTITGDKNVTVVLEDNAVTFNGTLKESDGDPASNVDVVARQRAGEDEFVTETGSDGNFSMLAEQADLAYALGYYQGDRDQRGPDFMPRDGSPDLYTFDLANGTNATDVGTVTPPQAHVLNVTVVDESGDPVPNVTVYVGDSRTEGSIGHGIGLFSTTDANGKLSPGDAAGIEVVGTVTARVYAPDSSRFVDDMYTQYFSDLTSDENLTITLQERVNVSGQIDEADGTPSSDDLLAATSDTADDFPTANSDSGGNFSLTGLAAGERYSINYYQSYGSDSATFPRDGSPDVYVVDTVNVTEDMDLGHRDLPNASVLNVRVVDEDGDPVEGADAAVVHRRLDTTAGFAGFTTDSAGYATVYDRRGVEMTGNVTVEVRPSENNTRFVNETTVRNVTVTSDRNVTVSLTERRVNFTARIDESDGTAASGDTVGFKRLPDSPGTRGYTNSSGEFTVELEPDERYQLEYYQDDLATDADLAFPDDGSPDLYALGRYNSSETRNLSAALPEAYDLNVTVETAAGAPIENAEVKIRHHGAGDAIAMHGVPTNAEGMMEPPTSDGPGFEVTGEVDVIVKPPENATYEPTKTSLTVTNATNLTMVLRDSIDISGNITEETGEAAADDLVFVPAEDVSGQGFAYTDAGGSFSLTVGESSGTYDVQYYQGNFTDKDETFMPRDGSPDLYSVASVNASQSTDLGNVSLPPANVLNVTVVNESDLPVENASVRVRHTHDEATTAIAGLSTDEQGRMRISNPSVNPGIEVRGNVTIEVTPPENATGYRNETSSRVLSVTNDTAVSVTLAERDETAPTITQFGLESTGQNLDVEVRADEELANLTVDLGGDASGTLTRENFTLVRNDTELVYTANVSDGRDGRFEATLVNASDLAGNDGANGESSSVVVDTHAPAVYTSILDRNDSDNLVTDGETVRIEATVVENRTSVANVTANATALGAGTVNLTHRFADTYAAAVTVSDADNGTHSIPVTATDAAGNTNVSSGSIEVDNAPPEISYFTVSSGISESTLKIEIHSQEQLKTRKVNLNNSNGNTITFTNLTSATRIGTYAYTVNYDVNKDGTYRATLVNATDAAGNRVAGEPTNETVVDTHAPNVSDFSMANDAGTVTVSFEADEELNSSSVIANVTNESGAQIRTLDSFSASGGTYTASFDAGSGVNETWTAELVRAEDDHGLDGASGQQASAFVDATAPTISAFDATFENGTLTVTFDADEELNQSATTVRVADADGNAVTLDSFAVSSTDTYTATYDVSSGVHRQWYSAELTRAEDPAGNPATYDTTVDVAVEVDTLAPTVQNFAVVADGQDVDLVLDADEDLTGINASVGGEVSETLSRADFGESYDSGTYTYRANVSNGTDGTFEATLGNASDAYGNDGATGQTASAVADTHAPEISNFSATLDATTIDVRLSANETLDADRISVVIENDEGHAVDYLQSFEETGQNEYWSRYEVNSGVTENWTVRLRLAEDTHGNDGATGQTEALFVDTVPPNVTDFDAAYANRTITATLTADEKLSAGDTAVSIVNESGDVPIFMSQIGFSHVEGTTYEATYSVRDGANGTYSVTLDRVTDDSGTLNRTDLSRTVVVDTTIPEVADFSARSLADGSIAVNFSANESLGDIAVSVSGPDSATLTEADFTNDSGTYTATYAPATDGEYTVTVERAADEFGNDGATGQTDSVVVDTHAPEISNFTATSADGRSVVVTFDSNESLVGISLVHEGLTEVDLSENETAGDYTYQWTLEADEDGEYTVRLVEAVDAHGNDGAGNRTVSAVVDTRAPNTSATLSGTETDAGFSSDVTLNLTVSDALSGVSETNYRLGGSGDWVPYDGNVTISGDGNRTVEFYSVDADGNAERRAIQNFTIDTHAPNSSVEASGDVGESGWFTSAVSVNVTATDETTGVERVEYRVDDGEWTTYDGNVTIADDGRHTVEYRAIDAVGNHEDNGSSSVEIDATDPETKFATNATESDYGWYDSDVAVNLSADDATSGVSETYYRVDDDNWSVYEGNLTITEDGNHTVEFYSVDLAGNVETNRTRTVSIDTTKPEFGSSPGLNRTDEILPEHAISVVVDARDGRGVADVTVGGVSVGPDGKGPVPASPKLGNHTFEVVITDLAGNQRVVEAGEYSVGREVEMNQTDNGTLSAETDDTNVGAVTIDPENETGNASVKVGTSKSNPTNSSVENGTSLYFPQINTSVSNDNIENASVTLTVEQSRVRQRYVLPGTVKFWVQNETTSEWTKVDARRVGQTDDTYTYDIEAPHFSTYAVTGDTESADPNITAFGPQNDSLVAGNVTLSASYGDGYSGIDPANVTLTLEDAGGTEDVTSEADVTDSGLAFTRNLSAGTYNATLSVTDNASNAASRAITFTVANRSSGGDDGNGGSGGGSGGSGGGGGGGAGGAPPPAVQVSVVELTQTGFRAEIANARSGSAGRVSLDGGIAVGDVTVQRLVVTPESEEAEARFFIDGAVSQTLPEGASALDATELGYLNLSTTYISSSALAEVGVTFAVPAESAAVAENVALYRLDGGSWTQIETSVVAERGGKYVLRANAPGVGTFAVGAQGGDLSVTEASVGAQEVQAGGTVEVTATVENVGEGAGTATAEISVGGETVAEEQVTVSPGESETVTVEVTLDSPGTHEIAVNGVSAGEVSVAGDSATTAEGGDGDSGDGSGDDGSDGDSGSSGGIPGFGVSATLAALAAGLLVARRLE